MTELQPLTTPQPSVVPDASPAAPGISPTEPGILPGDTPGAPVIGDPNVPATLTHTAADTPPGTHPTTSENSIDGNPTGAQTPTMETPDGDGGDDPHASPTTPDQPTLITPTASTVTGDAAPDQAAHPDPDYQPGTDASEVLNIHPALQDSVAPTVALYRSLWGFANPGITSTGQDTAPIPGSWDEVAQAVESDDFAAQEALAYAKGQHPDIDIEYDQTNITVSHLALAPWLDGPIGSSRETFEKLIGEQIEGWLEALPKDIQTAIERANAALEVRDRILTDRLGPHQHALEDLLDERAQYCADDPAKITRCAANTARVVNETGVTYLDDIADPVRRLAAMRKLAAALLADTFGQGDELSIVPPDSPWYPSGKIQTEVSDKVPGIVVQGGARLYHVQPMPEGSLSRSVIGHAQLTETHTIPEGEHRAILTQEEHDKKIGDRILSGRYFEPIYGPQATNPGVLQDDIASSFPVLADLTNKAIIKAVAESLVAGTATHAQRAVVIALNGYVKVAARRNVANHDGYGRPQPNTVYTALLEEAENILKTALVAAQQAQNSKKK